MSSIPTPFTKVPSEFSVKESICKGILYLPDGPGKAPVIIMAHGFGGIKSMRLDAFAERFALAGMAVFVFDYRGFGESEGPVPQLVSPSKHIEDWQAAVAHVRTLEEIDSSRIGLWGFSYSGGHVLVTAAKDGKIAAMSAMMPFFEPWGTMKHLGVIGLAKATWHGIRDFFRVITFRSPYYVPVVAPEGTFAALNTEGCYEGYIGLVPKSGEIWENRCTARALVTFALYWPVRHAKKLSCPALVIIGDTDTLIGSATSHRAANKIPNSIVEGHDCGHFDGFYGEKFEEIVEKQTAFFQRELMSSEVQV